MLDVESAIEVLLSQRPAGFRNQHLAEALGVSRGSASHLLAARVRSGELERVGEGRGPYVRGPDAAGGPHGLARGARPQGFWRELSKALPRLCYVRLSALGLTQVRTRQQARLALRGIGFPLRFLIIDFEGIASVSPAAGQELLFGAGDGRAGMNVEAINAEPEVARALLRVARG